MPTPPAEVFFDEALVRGLLVDQHPDLAGLPLVEATTGWDNALWRLGSDLAVRLPRRALGAPLTVTEQRWLPVLAPLLPLPIPVPLRCGVPGLGYPWHWSVVPWLTGTPGDLASITDVADAAGRLGLFLAALHRPAPADAPTNPYRSVPLSARAATFSERVARLGSSIDAPAVRAVWSRALDAEPWPGPRLWLHGDLHPANTLVGGGTLVGVLDFGDLCAGDPATDLAGVPLSLPPAGWPAFLAAYGEVDPATWTRAEGWAALFALMLLDTELPTYRAVARRTLARVTGQSE